MCDIFGTDPGDLIVTEAGNTAARKTASSDAEPPADLSDRWGPFATLLVARQPLRAVLPRHEHPPDLTAA